MKRNRLFAVSCLVWLGSAHAQHTHGMHGGTVPQSHGGSGYAGLQSRAIKALSEQEIADLRAGKGMSMALPAELNGYPGPSHVLELAEPLGLSEAQRTRTEVLFREMQAQARAAGEAVIEAESVLDRLFAERRATDATLSEAIQRAALARARVRATHLRHHLRMLEVLTPEQVFEYKRLRGYRD